jgi:hypothetical protein
MKWSVLAHYEPVTLVTPPNVERKWVQDTAPKLQDVMVAARSNLSNAESRKMEELLSKYRDIFVTKSDDYGRTDRLYHHMGTGEARLIQQLQRMLLLEKQVEVGKMLNDMVVLLKRETGPVVLIQKKNRDLHFCMD